MTNDTSLFTYIRGYTTENYFDDAFVPIFLDEVNATLRNESEQVCGGGGNIGCVFDYIATENKQLALGTKQASEDAKAAVVIGGKLVSFSHNVSMFRDH